MYEDPQDMFREMEFLFSQFVARMNRDFPTGEFPAIGFHVVMPMGGEPPQVPEFNSIPHRGSTEPVAEVHRMDNEVKVITELPGITKEDIKLNVQGSELTIDSGDGHVQFHTTAALPLVDPGSIQVSFKNGVLEVTFMLLPDTSDEVSL